MATVFLRRPNEWFSLRGRKKLFQTFIPTHSYLCDYIDLNCDDMDRNPTLSIYEAAPDHTPIGHELTHWIAMPFKDPKSGSPYRWRWPVKPVDLYQDTLYGIYFNTYVGHGENPFNCHVGYRTGNEYPQGKMMYKDDYLDPEWSEMENCDVTFGCFGESFVVPGPPYAPVFYWALTSIEYDVIELGLRVTVTTNVPVHLYLYHTAESPWKHQMQSNRRGDLTMRDIRFCFVNWQEVEQNELGDTLTHTFDVTPWLECTWKWYAFRGTIDDEWSPSTSPIFARHREYQPTHAVFRPDPYPEISDCDGIAWREARYNTYSELRNGSGTGAGHWGANATPSIRSDLDPDTWRWLYRAYFNFDVHTIPEDAFILNAFLRLHGEWKTLEEPWPNFDVCISGGNTASDTEIVPSDYGRADQKLLSADIIHFRSWKIDDWNEFQLNAAGLNEVEERGVVKLCLRLHYYDVLNNEPPWVKRKIMQVNCWTADKDLEYAPQLEVWWIRQR